MSLLQWVGSQTWVDALGWTLVHSVWEGVVVAIILAIVMRSMRSMSANARYVIALVALMILPAGAVSTFGLLNRQAPPPKAHAIGAPSVVVQASAGAAPVVEHDVLPQKIFWSDRLGPLLPWLVMVWIGGVAISGTVQMGGWVLVRRIRASGVGLDDPRAIAMFRELLDRLAISRSVKLAQSALVQVPSVIGAFAPLVILPINALTGLTTDQLRGLLTHELAHVRRHDYLVNAIQTIIETLLFYHPAVWWISRVIRQERENACDDLAARVCDPATYAQALATMERLRHGSQFAMSAKGGALLPRIRRILGIPDAQQRRRFASTIASVFVAVSVVVLLCVINACSSTTKPTTATVQVTTDAITPDDMLSTATDYAIGPNDLVQVEIDDLRGKGIQTVKQARVSELGKIHLPLIGDLAAVGLTEDTLEKAIAAAYEKGGYLQKANVSATVIEQRSETFSILGAVQQPGQYAIQKIDFRILDALVLARGETGTPDKAIVVRNVSPEHTRRIEVPLTALRAGDLRYNLVIRPNDLIIVPGSQEATAEFASPAPSISQPSAAPATQSITAADLHTEPSDYCIVPEDRLSISVWGLTADNAETKLDVHVSDTGAISLPMVGKVAIANRTAAEAEALVKQTYQDAGLLKSASVMVSVTEARGRTFTILFTQPGIGESGEYPINISDFRLLNAMSMSRAALAQIDQIKIRRHDDDKDNRLIEIPGNVLLTGDPQYNIVIRPRDTIIVQARQTTAQAPGDQKIQTASENEKQIALLKLDAESTARIDAAKADVAVKQMDFDRKLQNPSAYGDEEVQKAKASLMQATSALTLAQEDQRRAQIKYEQSAIDEGHDQALTKLQYDLEMETLALKNAESTYGEQSPSVQAAKRRVDNLKKQLDEAKSVQGESAPATQSAATTSPDSYYISGLPRSGVYPFDGHELNLRYALVTAGYTPDLQDKSVSITRRFPDGDKVVFSSRRVGDVIEGTAARPILQPNDVIMVEVPRDNATAHFVRLVVGPHQMTLDGKPVNWDNLTDELKKLPDGANTALELAMASGDLTVDQEYEYRGLASYFVRKAGLKYMTIAGVHPLGSKAGDDSPATQPAGAAPANTDQYYVGGHVKRTGAYSLSDREIHLRQAIASAGGFDDPKMGDDTLITLKRKVQGKGVPTYYRWGDTNESRNDPILHEDDVIEVGVAAPTTQPPPPFPGAHQYRLEGNIARPGTYTLPDGPLHLSAAITQAGGIADRSLGSHTRMMIMNQPDKSSITTSMTSWGEIQDPQFDPLVVQGDVISVSKPDNGGPGS
jgi:protein involved in polysaccharide export with SLBB domain/beta-lactamase regulating signal transducer with metallopeptidase domain